MDETGQNVNKGCEHPKQDYDVDGSDTSFSRYICEKCGKITDEPEDAPAGG
jgi:transposase-like protein